MRRGSLWFGTLVILTALAGVGSPAAAPPEPIDMRDIRTGQEIPTLTYSDQPYIVRTDDGAWLCVVTTGVGHEGQPGQIVSTQRSTDRGRSWSAPVAVEPADGPEASYAVLLKVPGGRIYVFYNHNTDNIREVPLDRGPGQSPGVCKRVDSLGYFVFKYSDDGGVYLVATALPDPHAADGDRSLESLWRQGALFLERGQAIHARWGGLHLAAQGGRDWRRVLYPERRGAAQEHQPAHRTRSGEDHVGDVARGGFRPADAARRRPDRRGAELRGTQRRLFLQRLSHDRRPSGLCLQPRCRPALDHAAVSSSMRMAGR